jgi:hypothetical protein
MAGSIYTGYYQCGAIPVREPSAEYNVVSAPQGLRSLLEFHHSDQAIPAGFDPDQV